jgi:hypothetical protein
MPIGWFEIAYRQLGRVLYGGSIGLFVLVAVVVLATNPNVRRLLASDFVAKLDADIELQDSPRDIGDKLRRLYEDVSRKPLIGSMERDHGLQCDAGQVVRCSKSIGGMLCPQTLIIDFNFDQAERLKSASVFTENPCN